MTNCFFQIFNLTNHSFFLFIHCNTINKIGVSIVQTCNIPANTTISAAEKYTYTFTISNLSEIPMEDVILTDKLPDEVQLKSVETIYSDGTKSTDVSVNENGEMEVNLSLGELTTANVKVEVSSPIMWMNAAEVMFLRAEAALRGWDTEKTPKAYYEAGIRLSFEQLGAKNVEDYLVSTNTPESYKDPLGTYSFSGTPSTISVQWKDGNFEESLERIITQKWIANFPLGLEAWAEFRRTGYPKLMGTASNKSGGDIEEGKFPRRLTYPQDEYKTNSENIRKAVTSLGRDYMHSRICWDCYP